MKRLLAIALLAIAVAGPALAHAATTPRPSTIPQLLEPATPRTFLTAVPQVPPTAAMVPAVGTTTATLQAPADSGSASVPAPVGTTVSIGTLGGQLLNWIAVTFAVPIGGLIVGFLVKLLVGVGISVDDARRARLQQLVVNGLHAGAAALAKGADGKVPVNLKSELLAKVVSYVQAHGGDLIKKLGSDPNADATVKAIVARAEVALADPKVPVSIDPTPAAEPDRLSVDDMMKGLVEGIAAKIAPRPAPVSPAAAPSLTAAAQPA